MKENEVIVAVKLNKKEGEFVITTKNPINGKTYKSYANHLSENEKTFAKASKHYYEDDTCVCWAN